MTLNDAERRRTSNEFVTNFKLSGLTVSDVAADLHFTLDRLQSCMHVASASDAVDVWMLRDYLEQAAQDAGQHPAAYTVLTRPARLFARTWFPLRKAPRHEFDSR